MKKILSTVHRNEWFTTKAAADKFCDKKNKSSRIYIYRPVKSETSGNYFVVGSLR